MKSRAFFALSTLVLASARAAVAGPNGSIDLFWIDPQTEQADLTSCQGTTDFIPGILGDLKISVQARLAGLTAGGIQGCEFFIEGLENLPSGWRCSGSSISGYMIGNICAPSVIGGDMHRDVTTAFPVCQGGTDGLVELFTLQVSGVAVQQDLPNDMHIRVVAGSPPLNPEYPCALLNLCDSPFFTKVCISGGEFIINPQRTNCTVGLEKRSWTRVKALYRD